MKNRNCRLLVLASLVLAATATLTRAQSVYTPYAFTNLAGLPGFMGGNDGTGDGAGFRNPYGIAVDSAGTVYVADSDNHQIRQITPAGEVTTLAGG